MSKLLFENDRQKFTRLSQDAAAYYRRAVLFAQQDSSPGLIFNVGSIAVECYLIALCAWYGSMPFNHNYASLMDSAEEVIEFDPALSARIRALDTIFGICSLDNYHHGTPTLQDSLGIVDICRQLAEILSRLSTSSTLTEK